MSQTKSTVATKDGKRERCNSAFTKQVNKASILMKLKGLITHLAVDFYLGINWFCMKGIPMGSSFVL